MEPVFREVVRAQRALAKKGGVAWGMWDVKGGFQNAREEAVVGRYQRSEKARRWTGYLKDFFRARKFTMEWDGIVVTAHGHLGWHGGLLNGWSPVLHSRSLVLVSGIHKGSAALALRFPLLRNVLFFRP